MRRALTLAILLLFGLAPLSALMPGAEDAALPACCRRLGAHHCAMGAAASTTLQDGAGFAAQNLCPLYRVQVRAISPAFLLPSVTESGILAELRIPLTAARGALMLNPAAHAGRGPPTIS